MRPQAGGHWDPLRNHRAEQGREGREGKEGTRHCKTKKAGKTWQKPCVLIQDQPKCGFFQLFSQLVHEKPVFF